MHGWAFACMRNMMRHFTSTKCSYQQNLQDEHGVFPNLNRKFSNGEFFFFLFLWSHNQSEAIVHLTEHKAIHLLLRFNLNTVVILCANMFSFSNISLRKLYRTCFICMIRALRKVFFRLNFAIVALLFSRWTFILSRWSCFMQKQSHPWGW